MNDESSSGFVTPDPLAIERHLHILFGYLDGFVPVRLISERGTPSKRPNSFFSHSNDPEFVRAVQRTAATAHLDARAVFVVPGVVVEPGSAKAENIVGSGVLLVDLDFGDIAAKRDHLIRHLGSASLIVASGGRTDEGQEREHVYWRLTEAAIGDDLKTLTVMRAKLAVAVGGDDSFDSVHQPIRVAGTIHGKSGVKTLVRILDDTGLEYELSDLSDRVKEMPAYPKLAGESRGRNQSGERKTRFSTSETMKRRCREEGRDGETRYAAISKVIGHWIRMARFRHVSMEEAWRAVVEFNSARIQPPWENDRLHREFLALCRVDERQNGPMPGDHAASQEDDAVAPPLSEDGLAATFVEKNGSEWRHVAVWGAWLRWSGTRWLRDETLSIREAVRQVCRSAIGPETTGAEAKRVASEKTIRAVERIAAADPRIAARTEDWDADPYLLNTPAGIVHLDTGEILPHQPARMLTHTTNASPAFSCPMWRGFLAEITDGDTALADYLQRFAGYCLAASTEEQVFAFLYGTGANGKSVFLQTLSSVLGTYAATAPLSAFMASRNDPHPTDLAGLVGKRLVTVSETEPGRAWAETRIKTITGGDRLRARFMQRDFFEFSPTFKLVVAGNHRPRLTGVGEAMRRRMHLVPFTVTIPPERRDKRLCERLLGERDGVLGWMLEGYLNWREKGLAPPVSVVQSAQEYFDDEDVVGQWIAENCVTGPECRATAGHLFADWSDWGQKTGADIGSQKTLGDALRERGFASRKFGGKRGWIGIGLRRKSSGNGEAGA